MRRFTTWLIASALIVGMGGFFALRYLENDEAFSFHSGGVNAVMGDGSVRFIRDSIDALTLRYLVAATDGKVFNLD